MNKDIKFQLHNKLKSKSMVKSITMENKYYKIKVNYMGDYEHDFENDDLHYDCIQIRVESKESLVDIHISPTLTQIDLTNYPPYISNQHSINMLNKYIEIAKLTLIEFDKVYNHYFKKKISEFSA